MAKVTIDGTEVEVQDGINIIEAAKVADVHVPHFCYHPSLTVVGQYSQDATGRLVSNLAKDLDGTGQSLNQALEGLGGLAATVASKDKELGRIIDHFDGFSATLATREETEEGVQVSIHNCPFRNTALKFPQVCSITPQLISRLTGAAISQSDSIHRRDPYCSFVVQRPTDS